MPLNNTIRSLISFSAFFILIVFLGSSCQTSGTDENKALVARWIGQKILIPEKSLDNFTGLSIIENKFKFHFVLAKDIDHYKGYISKLVIGSFSPKLPTVLLCKNGDVFCSYFSSDLGVEKSLELKPYFNADGNSGFVLMLYKYNI